MSYDSKSDSYQLIVSIIGSNQRIYQVLVVISFITNIIGSDQLIVVLSCSIQLIVVLSCSNQLIVVLSWSN